MAAQDLTTLENLKQWLPINSTNVKDDATIARLITATSDDFMHSVERPDLLQATYNEVRVGDGASRLTAYHWPIAAVSSLTIGSRTVTASADKIAAGYYLDTDIDPERIFNLWLAGGLTFADGLPVKIAYTAGYTPPGTTLTTGQIALPTDIEQAVIDWCTYRYNERPNVSATERRSNDGETIHSELIDAPPNVLALIERYKRVLPSLDRRQDEREERMMRGRGATPTPRNRK